MSYAEEGFSPNGVLAYLAVEAQALGVAMGIDGGTQGRAAIIHAYQVHAVIDMSVGGGGECGQLVLVERRGVVYVKGQLIVDVYIVGTIVPYACGGVIDIAVGNGVVGNVVCRLEA